MNFDDEKTKVERVYTMAELVRNGGRKPGPEPFPGSWREADAEDECDRIRHDAP